MEKFNNSEEFINSEDSNSPEVLTEKKKAEKNFSYAF